MKRININVGEFLKVYGTTQEGVAVDIYAFGYRVRWYSNPKYFSIIKIDGWVKVI